MAYDDVPIAAIETIDGSPGTFAHVARLVVVPSPSVPFWFCPVAQTEPSASSASVNIPFPPGYPEPRASTTGDGKTSDV